jgi:hypothetical protein
MPVLSHLSRVPDSSVRRDSGCGLFNQVERFKMLCEAFESSGFDSISVRLIGVTESLLIEVTGLLRSVLW